MRISLQQKKLQVVRSGLSMMWVICYRSNINYFKHEPHGMEEVLCIYQILIIPILFVYE